jgi:N6-adenosine-specific RNA methylase IME4
MERTPGLLSTNTTSAGLDQGQTPLLSSSWTEPDEPDELHEPDERDAFADVGELRVLPLPTVEGGFQTVLADPPWRFVNRTGKVAPEHRRLDRYDTMTTDEICSIPVSGVLAETAHLYLWVPNALLADGLRVMQAWGFTYKSMLVWHKVRKDGGSDGRGVGFYFRNVTEPILFGVRGRMRTLGAGRRQVNLFSSRKREHSRKPDEQYEIIEQCSAGPYLELFARYPRDGWYVWGMEASPDVTPRGRRHPGYR